MELIWAPNGVGHYVPRKDAVKYRGRWYVPTSDRTKWVGSWAEFKDAGGIVEHSEDNTELTLHLPEPYKFACGFNTEGLAG